MGTLSVRFLCNFLEDKIPQDSRILRRRRRYIIPLASDGRSSDTVKGSYQMSIYLTFRRRFMQSIFAHYPILDWMSFIIICLHPSSNDLISLKTYLIIDVFMSTVSGDRGCTRCHVTVSRIIFFLGSPFGPPHPISEARVKPRRGCRRRRSYRRGKLGETDSRSSRLCGSMLLPNSTESETESVRWTSSSIRPAPP